MVTTKTKTTTKTKNTGKTAERVGNVYTGGGDPENSLGENGDVYIRTSGPSREYHITEKRNGKWLKLVSLKGDKGDRGDTGMTGPRGDTGNAGAPGETGLNGLDGQLTEDQLKLLYLLTKQIKRNTVLNRDEHDFVSRMLIELEPKE